MAEFCALDNLYTPSLPFKFESWGEMETRINAANILIVDDEIGSRESLRMI